MSPENAREIMVMFLKIFSQEWQRAYKIMCEMGKNDQKDVGTVEEQIAMLDEEMKGLDGKPLDYAWVVDHLSDAKNFFSTQWDFFKFECARKHLILTEAECLKLLGASLDFPEVWEGFVRNDPDFKLFDKIVRHIKERDAINAARVEKKMTIVEFLERQQAVRRALERNLLKSKREDLPLERLQLPFAKELEAIIIELENEGMFSSPKEMSMLITELCPRIPKKWHQLLNKYVLRLQAIKDNPKPKLKEEIYRPLQIKLSRVQIDHKANEIKINEMRFQFSPKGIVSVFDALMSRDDLSVEEFGIEIRSILQRIREYCQENRLAGFDDFVNKLKKKYNKMWIASDRRSNDSLMIGRIVSALGLLHVDMFESKFVSSVKR